MYNVLIHEIAKYIPHDIVYDGVEAPYIFNLEKRLLVFIESSREEKGRSYYQSRFLLAKSLGIHLITIFDVDWFNNQEKIISYLHSLFPPQIRIFARKCEVVKIDNEVACAFVDKYHLQGANRSTMKINYGLVHEGKLLAVMSFGKLRLKHTNDGQYELHRFAVKDHYSIAGGASKLYKAFEREYSPKYVLSYSDNDIFLGGVYSKLGFSCSGQCTPRYYWMYFAKELKREQCQLKRLKIQYPDLYEEAYEVGASNKEIYIMHRLGAKQIWRSGNTKWEKMYVQ